ncbi:MAG: DUF2589 domain-containing protein [Prevotella sp.]
MALGDKDLTAKPFADIIQRAVSCCTQAQFAMFDSMMDYVERSTFVTQGGKRELAMLHFSFHANGQQHTIKLPLVTVVPPQLIQLREAEFNFNVCITKLQTTGSKKSLNVRFSPSRRAIREVASSESASQFDIRNVIQVSIKASDLGMSGGMSRLLELAGTQAISLKTPDST